MKFPLRSWYRGQLPYSRLAVTFAGMLTVAVAALASLVLSGRDDTAARLAFSTGLGFAVALAGGLAVTAMAWYQAAKSRRNR